MGNVEAKELIGMTHGHELKGGECGWEGGVQGGGEQRGENGKTNSIINKIYYLKINY